MAWAEIEDKKTTKKHQNLKKLLSPTPREGETNDNGEKVRTAKHLIANLVRYTLQALHPCIWIVIIRGVPIEAHNFCGTVLCLV